jgi:hypothetical protein
MREAAAPPIASLQQHLEQHGYAHVPADDMRPMLETCGSLADWERFASSWNDLGLDTYMADGGRYRRRRHAAYAAAADGSITRKPHQPHYQSRDYNVLHGGIARWFQPVADDVGAGPTLTTIVRFCAGLFGSLAAAPPAWHVEVHQFRIEAKAEETARPTPEGMHRDGVDYVLVLLIARRNIVSGTTSIHALDGRALGSFTLTEPFDAALVDDARVFHGVTPVEPLDPSEPAYRDVLVVTFSRRT